jgi:hypothetical protein
MRRCLIVCGFVIAHASIAHRAMADAKADAERLFLEAVALTEAGRHVEACPTYKASLTLDAAAGTQFRLAECYEATGRLVEAIELFSELERLMRIAGDGDRARKASARAAAATARAPKVALDARWAADRADVEMIVDGTLRRHEDLAMPVLVDPGPRKVAMRVRGAVRFETVVEAREGQSTTVHVPESAASAAPPPAQHAITDAPRSSRVPWKAVGVGVAVVGVVGFGLSTLLAVGAKSSYDDAKAGCGGPSGCPEQSVNDADAARNDAAVATAIGVASLAAVAGGVVLWVVAPSARPTSTVSLGPMGIGDGGGIRLRFSTERF